ncbi:MAG: conjugative relaxase, partial [Legionellales bacterium]|nr:conjugative relaxase [Legionellales bacterium]
MLSHKLLTRKDIGKAANYYLDAVDDYYAKTLDSTAWQGKGAVVLGLEGAIESERFRELLAGRIDSHISINRASIRSDSKTRLGIDLTFSAPKSVSLQALVYGDIEIIKAHEYAVERAIEMAETRAQARKKIQGQSMIEVTGNLVVGKFRHETSRAQDPQLHTHAIVMNLTQRSDGQWRA